MAVDIRWAKDSETGKIVRFINDAFELDFKEAVPKFYTNLNYGKCHVIAEDNGEILACTGVFDNEVMVLNTALTLQIIGSVSVSKNARGMGLMKKVMDEATSKVDNSNVDFAVLCGDRQRYEYYGYTVGGQMYEFNYFERNMPHLGIDTDIKFKLIDKGNIDLYKINQMHNEKAIRFLRRENELIDILHTGGCNIYTIYHKNIYIGYIVAKGDRINEMYMLKPLYTKAIIAYMSAMDIKNIFVNITPMQTDAIKECSLTAQRYTIKDICNFKIYNYPKVITAYLELKKHYQKLEKGSVILSIKDKCTMQIKVTDTMIEVKEVKKKADVEYTEFEAIQMLFSSAGYACVDERLRNWFPLPLYVETQDNA